ncbi:MAG: hypothetical protein KF832_11680 [Caldilineaceae bacterium]|nr:hypothetical protein [Caldilineaceae bacterium]
MLASTSLRPKIGITIGLRHLLLVSLLMLMLTSFAVIADCEALPWTDPDLCFTHLSRPSEHAHLHLQLMAILPQSAEGGGISSLRLDLQPALLPDSPLLDLIKPPPRV